MTTAHRPTWKAAVGRAQEGGWDSGGAKSGRLATLDLASHTKLKIRKGPQIVDKRLALQESLLKLEEAESKAPKIMRRQIVPAIEEEGRRKLLKQTAEVDEENIRSRYDDKDDDHGGKNDDGGWSDLDGEDSDLDESDSDGSDQDEDDEDDDEEAALQAELAKIRAEREAKKAKEEAEAAAQEDEKLQEAALMGNPLLSGGPTSGRLKRRWNDDVVFRNQAKGEPEIKKRFINDTVRNDFHKRFLNKFIK